MLNSLIITQIWSLSSRYIIQLVCELKMRHAYNNIVCVEALSNCNKFIFTKYSFDLLRRSHIMCSSQMCFSKAVMALSILVCSCTMYMCNVTQGQLPGMWVRFVTCSKPFIALAQHLSYPLYCTVKECFDWLSSSNVIFPSFLQN